MRPRPQRGPHCAAVVLLLACLVLALGGCAAGGKSAEQADAGQTAAGQASAASQGQQDATTKLTSDFINTDLGNGWKATGGIELQYAQRFALSTFEGGYVLACMADGNRYLVVPEGKPAPSDLSGDIIVLEQPINNVYLTASDTLCLFDALDALDRITVSGIQADDWYLPAMREAMQSGRVAFGGKYRAPDYELLLSRNVGLAVENTMINHAPDVREKLLELGIPVLVELSSYESEPLGRTEWIKLYGVLFGKEEQAQAAFQRQVDQVSAIGTQPTGKTVAFFYLNASGAAVVRRPGDYVTKMIEQAGGTYAFNDLDEAEAGSSSTTIQMEQFFLTAKDADVLVYNSSVDDNVRTLDDLLQKSELLASCKAVQSGNVWITDQNMYQQMIDTGGIIADFRRVLEGSSDNLTYLRKLE